MPTTKTPDPKVMADRIIDLIVNHESLPDVHAYGSLWANLLYCGMLNEAGLQGAKHFLKILEDTANLPQEKRTIQ